MQTIIAVLRNFLALMCFVFLTFGPIVFGFNHDLPMDEKNPSSESLIGSPLAVTATKFDFDGDRKADIAVFRPSSGVWYIANSGGGLNTFRFGLDGDTPVAADYDGDGKSDPAVYRGGVWYRLKSSNNTVDVITYGNPSDIPVHGYFDGDSREDIAVFRPSEGQWHILTSQNNAYVTFQFGFNGDIPIPVDQDGDGKSELVVFRPSNGTWYVYNLSNNQTAETKFGQIGDIPVAADYDGDGKSDWGVFRPSNATWYLLRSTAGPTGLQFGESMDIPVPADYDADGKADIAVFRPSNGRWYRINSSNNTFESFQFGISTDIAIASLNSSFSTSPSPSFTCDYYASPNGTVNASGSGTNPWDLQTALGKTSFIRSGKTLCLKGGTYNGKYRSTLNGGGGVRSAPGEWAKIDGYKTTTLTNAINSSQTMFSVADASGIFTAGSDEIVIGGEVIKIYSKSGNNVTGCIRGASNSLNMAESHLASTTVIVGGDPLYVAGSNTLYRDFEVMNSRPNRDGNTENQEIGRGDGIRVVGDNNKLINLIVHDNLSGIVTSGTSSNTEINGCLIYNNGMHSRRGGSVEEGLGHGMYLENGSGYSKIYDDIVLNSFNLGTQCYGVTAPYVGGDLNGSVWSNSGSPLGKFDVNKRNYNLIVGPDSQTSPTAILRNSHFFHPSAIGGYSVKFGYGAGVTNGTITGNYFVGGGILFEIANTPNANISGNQFYSSRAGTVYAISAGGQPYSWDNNTYHAALGREVFGVTGASLMQFANWKSTTGFDASAIATSSPIPNTAIVRPNSYEAGRANVMIYNFSGAMTANINLSASGLINGQQYTIRNAQNYFGAPVASGTYNSANSTIVVSLVGAAQSVATPLGYDYTPPSTCPQFCPMIVVPN